MTRDETTGKTQCEGSVLNGDCGITTDMVVSGLIFHPDSQEQETANNTSLALDAKSGIPLRSSIIKVYSKNVQFCISLEPDAYAYVLSVQFKRPEISTRQHGHPSRDQII